MLTVPKCYSDKEINVVFVIYLINDNFLCDFWFQINKNILPPCLCHGER